MVRVRWCGGAHHVVGLDVKEAADALLDLAGGVVDLGGRSEFSRIDAQVHHQPTLHVMHHLHHGTAVNSVSCACAVVRVVCVP